MSEAGGYRDVDAELSDMRDKLRSSRQDCERAYQRAREANDAVVKLQGEKREVDRELARLSEENAALQNDLAQQCGDPRQSGGGGGGGWGFFGSGRPAVEEPKVEDTEVARLKARLAEEEEERAQLQTQLAQLQSEQEQVNLQHAMVLRSVEAESEKDRDELRALAKRLRQSQAAVSKTDERLKQAVAAARREEQAGAMATQQLLLSQMETATAETLAQQQKVRELQDRLVDYEGRGDGGAAAADGAASGDGGVGVGGVAAEEQEAEEEEDLGVVTRLQILVAYLREGMGDGRPSRRQCTAVAERCIAECEALMAACAQVEQHRRQLEEVRFSALRRSPEHRGKDDEEIMRISMAGHEGIVQTAMSAEESAMGEAEEVIWNLLAESGQQRMLANEYKRKLRQQQEQVMARAEQERAAIEAGTSVTPAAAASVENVSGGGGLGLHFSPQRRVRSRSHTSSSDGMAASAGGGGGGGAGADPDDGMMVPPSMSRLRLSVHNLRASNVELLAQAADDASSTVGYLWKRGAVKRTWKQRWCELKGPLLVYYTACSDSEPRGVINLAECTLREDWAGSRSHSFKLIEGGEINGGVGKGNPSMLAAESEADKQQWIQLIQGVTRDHGHDRSKE